MTRRRPCPAAPTRWNSMLS